MIHPSDWQCLRLGGWKNWTLIIGDHRWFHRWFTGDLPWKNPCRLAFRRDHSCSPPESANKESNLLESQIAPALWAFSLEVLFQDLWPRGLNPLSAFFSLFFSWLLGYEPPYSCCVCCPNRFCTFRGFPSHAAPPVIIKKLDSPCNKPSSYIRVPHDYGTPHFLCHELPTQGCLRDLLWSAGQRPQHVRDEWTWHGGLLRNERMHESAPKDITSYYILLHIILSLLYESESNCYVDNHRICRKKETLPTHRTLLSPQNRCSGISKHCGGVQFQAFRAELQLDFSDREPWKWHSNPR